MTNHTTPGLVVATLLCLTTSVHAEETSITLPTNDSTSSFSVYNSAMTNQFKVEGVGRVGIGQVNPRAQLEIGGTDGLLVTGTLNTGTARALGGGMRMHWYPRKGAFRVGMAESTWWDDDGSSLPKLALYSIGMGYMPRASGVASTAIGAYNKATGDYALALGSYSQASASHAIAIGTQAIASGIYSIALGAGADTNYKDGAVVIGDDTYFSTTYASHDNQISMRFAGHDGSSYGKAYRFFTSFTTDEGANTRGVYMNGNSSGWVNYSSRDLKEHFRHLDGEEILGKIRKLAITEWNYKGTPEIKYIGPIAEEFWEAFHLNGEDNKGLNSISMDGVNMAGVQALEQRTSEMKADMAAQNAALRAEVETLKAELATLKAQMAALDPRLAAK